MRIRSAIGLMILIIVLKLLAPTVLLQGESTALSFLKGAEVSADAASQYAASYAAQHPTTPATPPYLPSSRPLASP